MHLAEDCYVLSLTFWNTSILMVRKSTPVIMSFPAKLLAKCVLVSVIYIVKTQIFHAQSIGCLPFYVRTGLGALFTVCMQNQIDWVSSSILGFLKGSQILFGM